MSAQPVSIGVNAVPPPLRDFLQPAKAAEASDVPRLQMWLLLLSAAFVASALAWAAWAPLTVVERGNGDVVPSTQMQRVQSLDAGAITSIAVVEGQHVAAGDLLISVDPTRASASLDEARAQAAALRGIIAARTAEQQLDAKVKFPDDLARAHPEIVAAEREAFTSRRRQLDASLATWQESLALSQRELDRTAGLVDRKLLPEVERVQWQQRIIEAQGRMSEATNDYRSRAGAVLSEAKGKLEALQQSTRGEQDRVARTQITSPVAGVIQKLHVNTPGQVIKPGEDLVEIVPSDDRLLVEAFLKPADVAFVRVGQPAVVKITAYDFNIFGSLPGTVEYVSADTIEREDRQRYFVVHVRTDRNHFAMDGHDLPVTSGMVAEGDVVTRKQTVLQYLLKPVLRATHRALSER